MIDVHRLRPLITLVLVLVTLAPSFAEMFTADLSPIVVLVRLALALALIGTLVWLISRVLLHYARIQAAGGRGSEDSQSSPQF